MSRDKDLAIEPHEPKHSAGRDSVSVSNEPREPEDAMSRDKDLAIEPHEPKYSADRDSAGSEPHDPAGAIDRSDSSHSETLSHRKREQITAGLLHSQKASTDDRLPRGEVQNLDDLLKEGVILLQAQAADKASTDHGR